MSVPGSIIRYLDTEGIGYRIVSHPHAATARQAAALAGIDAARVAQAHAVKDWRGLLLTVIPADHELDLETLNRQLQREFSPAPLPLPADMFRDCAPGTLPPLPAVFGLRTLIDSSLGGIDPLYFQAGSATELVRVSARGFALLQQGAWHGEHIARRAAEPALQTAAPSPAPAPTPQQLDIKLRVQQLTELPPMPEMAQRILQLRANPYASGHDLARVVELDPSLAGQIMRYASAPLFGYRGKLHSIQDAISRVLGYDLVMNIACGIAAGRAFRVPAGGPLGLDAFWRRSVYCAALSQSLSKLLPAEQRLRPGLAYLAGLLHDFGYLLFGHLFPREFVRFNSIVAAQPEQSLPTLERQLLGIEHTELGAWLMEAWRMPAEIITAVRAHHQPDCTDVYAGYARLVLLANHLLHSQGMGIGAESGLPPRLLPELGLSGEQLASVADTVLNGAAALDDMARQMLAA